MAINKKLISFATEAQFDAYLANNNIDPRSIVFIEDKKRIWTHGVFFDTSWNYISDTPSTLDEYGITDAAKKINSLYYVEGNTTGKAGAWTGSIPEITSLYAGLTIAYKIGVAGASTTNLDINSLGNKLVRRNTSNLTTHLPVESVVILTYDGTYWVWADYDSNNYDRTYWGNTITAGAPIYSYKLLMQGLDGKFYPLTLETGTGTTKTISTQEFEINSQILYCPTTTVAANGTTTNVYSECPVTTLSFTANQASWTSQQLIYLKGTILSNGNFKLDNTSYTSFMTQTLPTTEDGFVYVLLGYMYSTTAMRLFQFHPMYEYRDGALRTYMPIHSHGNITDVGAIGSVENKPIITGAGGVLQVGSFGTLANTFAEGNHTHDYLPLTGGTLTGALTANAGIILPEGTQIKTSSNVEVFRVDATKVVIGASSFDPRKVIITGNPVTIQQGFNEYTVYHSGNFTPSNYLPLSGGTLTGSLTLSQPSEIKFANNQFIRDNGGAGLLISSNYAINLNSATLTANGNNIWHSGNFNPASYLPLSGGTLTNNTGNILNLDTSGTDGSYIISKLNNVTKAYYGWHPAHGVFIQSGTAPNAAIGITDAQVPYFKTTSSGTVYNLWHAGNFNPANYLLLTGGTMANTSLVANLNADLLDGYHVSSILKDLNANYATALTSANDYPTDLLSGIHRTHISNVEFASILTGYDHVDNYWQLRFRPTHDRNIYYRNSASSSWSAIAFTDSNVASATKLQTASTIWGQSFDGTGNVTGALSGATTGVFSSNITSNSGISSFYDLSISGVYDAASGVSSSGLGFKGFGAAHATINWMPNERTFRFNTGNYPREINDAYGPANIEATGTIKATTAILTNLTANYLPKHTANGLVKSLIYDDGTNVGIGTATPSQKLHIYGGSAKLLLTDIGVTDLNNRSLLVGAIAANPASWEFSSSDNSGNNKTSYIVFRDSNVGIGTTNPLYKLDVSGTGRFTGALTASSTITATGNLLTSANLIANTGITIAQVDGTGMGISLYSSAGVDSSTNPTYGIMFATTANKGTHGAVTGDWATYFTMSNTAGRGWIFTTAPAATTGNVASISNTGIFTGTGFSKTGISDSYVLLAGGGHKAVTDFASNTELASLLDLINGVIV